MKNMLPTRNIWKIVVLEKGDVLVSKTRKEGQYLLEFTICASLGDNFTFKRLIAPDEEMLDRQFEAQDAETVTQHLRDFVADFMGVYFGFSLKK